MEECGGWGGDKCIKGRRWARDCDRNNGMINSSSNSSPYIKLEKEKKKTGTLGQTGNSVKRVDKVV